MNREKRFRVVGVRANGERIIVTKHTTREIAERVVNLIRVGTEFVDLLIEPDENGNGGRNP